MTPASDPAETLEAPDPTLTTAIAADGAEIVLSQHETQVAAAREWFALARFDGIVRLHTAREVASQQGTIQPDYTVARTAAEAFYSRLRELF